MGAVIVASLMLGGAVLASPGAATAAPPKHGFAAKNPNLVAPGCHVSPCPMGIVDYGITPSGGSTYSYSANEVESLANLSALTFSKGSTNAQCLDANSTACMQFQSNWVATGVEVHNNAGDYWTQNVVQVAYDSNCSKPCVSGTYSVTWLDNIWNFSWTNCTSSTGKGCMNSGDLKGNGDGKCISHGGAPKYYYCNTATYYDYSLPFSIWNFMSIGMTNSSPSSSVVDFSGLVRQGNTSSGPGYYDKVVFKSGSKGGGTPVFEVKPSNTPYGLPFDGEWVICGPGHGPLSGRRVTFSSITAELSTYYYHGRWSSIPHAWSSGANSAQSVEKLNMSSAAGPRPPGFATVGKENPATSLW